MAGSARFTALLDACVLFPAPVADALMSLHVAGLYTAKWTGKIDEEWLDAALRTRPEIRASLERRRDQMRLAVPDWEVSEHSYRVLESSLTLPDPNDVHVLAAAIAGRVDCIVTANLRDFPTDVLAQHDLEVIHPDDFIVYQMDLDTIPALSAFKEMRARLRKPALNADDFAAVLERNGLIGTADRLREAAALI